MIRLPLAIETEEIRFIVDEFKGNSYLSIRKWYKHESGEWRPTKEGFSFAIDKYQGNEYFLAIANIIRNSFESEALQTEELPF